MKKILLSLVLVNLFLGLTGQILNNHSTFNAIGSSHVAVPGMCKSDKKHIELMMSDSVYAKYRVNKHDEMSLLLKSPNLQKSLSGVVTIPIVVHVIHLGEAVGTGTNISDAQIQSAVDNLNDAYSNTGYNGLDIEIQFALAKRDENCSATTGINRVNGSGVSGYASDGITDANEVSVKALSKWSNNSYYNIWIVSEIDGNNAGGGTQGYAYFPGASSARDGAVVMFNSFGYDPTNSLGYNLKTYTNYNVTTIHEIGHGLDLYHTFQGDDSDSDGTPDSCPSAIEDGDFCNDTDPHRRDDSDCDAPVDLTCNGVAGSTVHNNFMAYTSDACQNRFTSNQKDRMRAALELERPGLVTSLGAVDPPAQAPNTMAASCEPLSSSSPNEGVTGGYGGIMQVSFGTVSNSTSNTANDHISTGTFGYLDYSQECNSYAEVEIGETVNVDVTTWHNDHIIDVFVDWNNNGVFDSGEEMLSLSTIGTVSGGDNNAVGTFEVPVGALTEEYIRIRFNADVGAVNGACEAPRYGQVEDYSLYVKSTTCDNPDVPVLSHSGTICEGSEATISISGNLNDATAWKIYSGSCAGTLVGTTSGGTFDVTPSGPSTTYFIRGEGGCVSPSSCGQITLNVNSVDDASFNYSSLVYCTNGLDPAPTITGVGGGTFSSTVGLSINASSGEVDLSNSTSGIYSVTYSSSGTCPSFSNESFEVETCNPVPNAHLRWRDRGKTMSTFGQVFYTTYVSGATKFDIKLTPQGGGVPVEVTTLSRSMTLQQAGLLDVGVTYDVQVRAHKGTDVGNYSSTYQLSSPVGVQNANLRAEDRGETLTTFSELFYTTYVAGASQYDIEMTPQGGGAPVVVAAGSNRSMTLQQAGLLASGVTYDVRVRAHVGFDIGNYSATYEISSPVGTPNANLRLEDRGKTLSSYSENFYTTYVAGASQFDIEFTPQGGGSPIEVTAGSNRSMTLQQAGLLSAGVTYGVRVKAYVNGAAGNYTSTFSITAPGSMFILDGNTEAVNEELMVAKSSVSIGLDESDNLLSNTLVYPNPFTDNLNIAFDNNNEKEINVYSAIGQLFVRVKTSAGLESLNLSEFKSGAYLIQVISEGQVKTFKVLKE